MEASVLQETRNLLNSLNDENSELKATNEHLTTQWRHATAELDSERRRFAQLEQDSKQINTNLVKQLQAKAAEYKGAQHSQDAMERRAQSMELQLERLAEEKAAAEDRCAATQRQLQEAVSREERERSEKLEARAAADRSASELAAAVAAQRERALSSERTLGQQCEGLSSELHRQQDLVATVRRQGEQQAAEHARAVEGLERRLERALQQAARTNHAEAESGFAHEAMRETAEGVFESLSDLHSRTRAAEIDAAETMNYIARITAKFRAVAQAASMQRRNSEEVVDFYSRAYHEAKSALTAALAENAKLRNSLSGKVEGAVAMAERQAREAAVRAERQHQEQLSTAIAELEAKQREQGSLGAELGRAKESLREAHETERQLRAFSEQLYADVIAANKVATEAAEKERAAKAELTTVEHRVAEQVRREVGSAFETERSRMAGELASAKASYELEMAEMRAQLDENHDTLAQALQRMTTHGHHHQQPQQQQRSMSQQQHQEQQPQSVPRRSPQSAGGGGGAGRSASAPFAFEQQSQQPPPQQQQQQPQIRRSASASASQSQQHRSPDLTDFMRSQLYGNRNVSLEGVDYQEADNSAQQQQYYQQQQDQSPASCSPVRNVVPRPQPQLTAAQQQYRKFQQQRPAAASSVSPSRGGDDGSPSQLQWPPSQAVRR